VPAEHGAQGTTVSFEKEPGPQEIHEVALASLYEPTKHGVHIAALRESLNDPGAHAEQLRSVAEVLFSKTNSPGAQLVRL